jgi:predicted RNase H-like nuclease
LLRNAVIRGVIDVRPLPALDQALRGFRQDAVIFYQRDYDARQFPAEETRIVYADGFHLRAVLGIDAAWTVTEPSGVAAAVERASGWRLAAVAASYEQFIARTNGVEPGEERPRGSNPSAADLLDSARRICGARVDLVAVDMPMARHPIVGRRPCDEAISSNYGARRAATHSPSASRPGAVSDTLRADFEAHGYALCTCAPMKRL